MRFKVSNIPIKYSVPGIVQPKWTYSDLVSACSIKEYEEELKNEICVQYGVKYCVLLNNARSGIYLLADSFGLENEWLTTSFMYEPLAEIIINNCRGLALADVNLNLTANIESLNLVAGKNTEVLLVNHFYGKCSDVKSLRSLANKLGLFLIENCVHVPGATLVDGQPIGSWGDAAILSFKADKCLGGLGGGALITNREDVWDKVHRGINVAQHNMRVLNYVVANTLAYKLRAYTSILIHLKDCIYRSLACKKSDSITDAAGEDYIPRHINSLQGKVALQLVKKMAHLRKLQIQKGGYLSDLLKDIDSIEVPDNTSRCPHTYTYFPIILNSFDRFHVSKKLSEYGVETKWRYQALHSLSSMRNLRWQNVEQTNNIINNNLLLPLSHKTTNAQIRHIANSVKSILT